MQDDLKLDNSKSTIQKDTKIDFMAIMQVRNVISEIIIGAKMID